MRGLILLLLGIIIGGFAMHVCDTREGGYGWHQHWSGDSLRDRADQAGDDLSDQLRRWHLTGDDIRDDLARGGDIIRRNAAVAGARISDARIETVIKAKYVIDKQLSARDIRVEVSDGSVTLTGSASSHALVGRAIALALGTDGVRQVVSHLTVEEK